MPDEEKHTPGPWEVGVTPSDGRRIALVLKGTDMLAKHNVYGDVHATRHQIEEQEPVANGHLIAAAPGLLAACEKMVQAVPPDGEALRASHSAERAIAKARGLGDSDLPDQDERGVDGLTGAGREVDELRDENERLKERVAELEGQRTTLRDAALSAHQLLTQLETIVGNGGTLDETIVTLCRALDASDENASREAEVPHE